MILSYRLGGLRPDEYALQDAADWYEAVVCQNAAAEGIALARSQKAAADELAAVPAGQVG